MPAAVHHSRDSEGTRWGHEELVELQLQEEVGRENSGLDNEETLTVLSKLLYMWIQFQQVR